MCKIVHVLMYSLRFKIIDVIAVHICLNFEQELWNEYSVMVSCTVSVWLTRRCGEQWRRSVKPHGRFGFERSTHGPFCTRNKVCSITLWCALQHLAVPRPIATPMLPTYVLVMDRPKDKTNILLCELYCMHVCFLAIAYG
jgi:hypothetical protein